MALTFDKDEVIVYEVRRHWFIFTVHIAAVVIFAFTPLFVYSVLKVLPIVLTAEGNVTILFFFIYSLWILISWIMGMLLWTDYFLDVMIITNKRLIRVEQYGLFSREISYLDLQNIQDVKSEIHGLLPTMLNFGHLTVQTAAQAREFIMESIANPFGTRDKLNQAIALYNKENPQTYVFAGGLEEDKQNRRPIVKVPGSRETAAEDTTESTGNTIESI